MASPRDPTHAAARVAGVAAMLVLLWCAGGLSARADDSAQLLARIGRYVEQYYGIARSILAEETVVLQPLAHNLSFEGFPRRLVYELRVDWDPGDGPDEATATVVRELISATGPPLGSSGRPDCFDPRAISAEPLAFLLPHRRDEFVFRIAGTARVDGRTAVRLDYEPVAVRPPQVEWDEECGRVELPGRLRGRIWADIATSAILRLDEHLVGMVDIPAPEGRRTAFGPGWFTLERADTSIRYTPVTFEDPDGTLMLPARIDSLTFVRNSGVPRLRTTRSFANYRRFVTDSRIVR